MTLLSYRPPVYAQIPLCVCAVIMYADISDLWLQVVALLRTAGGSPTQSWAPDQDELTETLWAEMGLQPDAHITLVRLPSLPDEPAPSLTYIVIPHVTCAAFA